MLYVIVVTFNSPSCLGQEIAKGPFGYVSALKKVGSLAAAEQRKLMLWCKLRSAKLGQE